MSVRFLATRAAFPVLLVGGLAIAVAACGDDDPVPCYPDSGVACGVGGGGGGADTGVGGDATGGSDTGGGGEGCDTFAGSCLFQDEDTTTCTDFYGSELQAGAFASECETSQEGTWSTGTCTSRGTFNSGCRTTAGFCVTTWYNAEPGDEESADNACILAGGTPE